MRPSVRAATLFKGVGVPPSVTVDGETFTRIRFGDAFLDVLISSQPLYGSDA